jgi:hypothetical protein
MWVDAMVVLTGVLAGALAVGCKDEPSAEPGPPDGTSSGGEGADSGESEAGAGEPDGRLDGSARLDGSPSADAGSAVPLADVLDVEVQGSSGSYRFSVTVQSPDTGCERYADWWEVLGPDGRLVYRRILAHSHVSEQPFTRSGGPVEVASSEVVIVRAHMNPGGYGGRGLRGTPEGGFAETGLAPGFASDVESAPPQPDGCAF